MTEPAPATSSPRAGAKPTILGRNERVIGGRTLASERCGRHVEDPLPRCAGRHGAATTGIAAQASESKGRGDPWRSAIDTSIQSGQAFAGRVPVDISPERLVRGSRPPVGG